MYRTNVVRINSWLCCILLLLAGFADSSRLALAAPRDNSVFTETTDSANGLIVADQSGDYGSTVMLTASITPAVAGKTVSFSVYGTNVGSTMTDVSGMAMLPYTIVNPVGNYPIVASFVEDDEINPETGSVTVSDQIDMFGNTVTLTAKLVPAAEGKIISFTVSGANVGSATTDVSGTAQLTYTIINPPGIYPIIASFAGDDDITAATGTSNLMVTKSISTLIANRKVGKKYDTIALTANYISNVGIAEKPVSFSVDRVDVGIAKTDASGTATLLYDINQDTGRYMITANYEADAYFTSATGSSDLRVSAPTYPLNVSNIAVPYGAPVTLRAMMIPAAVGKTISFTVDGVDAGSATTDADGMARLPYTELLTAGSHPIVASFAGDADIEATTDSSLLTVIQTTESMMVQDQFADNDSTVMQSNLTPVTAGKPVNTTVSNTATLIVTQATGSMMVQDQSGDYGSTVSLTSRLTPASAGKPISFTVDGVNAGIATTDASGTATVDYTIVNPAGSYRISTRFAGDADIADASGSSTLTVSSATTVLDVSNVTGGYGSSVTLSAALHVPIPVPGKLLEFKVNSVPVGTGVTDASGVAIMSVPYTIDWPAGNHIITVSFAGDSQVAESTGIGTLTVTQATGDVTVQNLSGEYGSTVTLMARLTPASVGKSISFTVDGANVGSATTDVAGSASITFPLMLSVGSYPITASFSGDAYISAVTENAVLSVTKATLELEVVDVAGTYGSTVELFANLDPVSEDREVNFYINGKSVGSARSDRGGTAAMTYTINEAPGTYIIRSDFAGDYNYSATSGTGTLTVAPIPVAQDETTGPATPYSCNDIAHPNGKRFIKSTNGSIIIPDGYAGEVSLDENIMISVKCGSAEKQLYITIRKSLDTAGLQVENNTIISDVFEITSKGADILKKPVIISLKFDPTKAVDHSRIALFAYDEDKKTWLSLGGIVDRGWITAEAVRFTKLVVMAVNSTPKQNISFTDAVGHWGERFIAEAVEKKLVNGYPDGAFRPDRPISRAEFTVMIVKALKLDGNGQTLAFADQSKIGQWAQQAVDLAVQAGIAVGYEDGTFRPEAPITRIEMTLMMARALRASINHDVATEFVDDETIPTWGKGAVVAISKLGIIGGRDGNQYMPNEVATRAEAVVILLRMLEYMESPSDRKLDDVR